MLIKTHNHYAWVCDSDPKVTGRFDLHGDEVGFICNYVISEANRDKGHGHMMMLELIQEARNRGMTTITLDVLSGNARAIHLYKKNGFTMPEYHRYNIDPDSGRRWMILN
jgi:ribosomal protein S18 acetylase RimI-like enzyme